MSIVGTLAIISLFVLTDDEKQIDVIHIYDLPNHGVFKKGV